jgi:hypothetical protein
MKLLYSLIFLLSLAFSEVKFNKDNLTSVLQTGVNSEKGLGGLINISMDYNILKDTDIFCGIGTSVMVNYISFGAKYFYKDFKVTPFFSSSFSTIFVPVPECTDCIQSFAVISSGVRVKVSEKEFDKPVFSYINLGFIFISNFDLPFWPIINYEVKF